MKHSYISQIRDYCAKHAFRYTQHFMQRIIQRDIKLKDVETALVCGEIIEDYPDDYPYPSCLVLGYIVDNKPLHVVCGIAPDELFLITAYYPEPAIWSDDYKTRKPFKRSD